MLYRCFVMVLALGATLLADTGPAPAQQPPAPENPGQLMRQLADAVRMVHVNQRDEALALLRSLAPRLPAGSLPRHTAELLTHQLTGAFASRQQRFLDRKVVDTVVLVPDEASFIAAIGAWTDERFFPVLIEDGWLAPLFIRAFEPRRVVRFAAELGDAGMSATDADKQAPARTARAIGAHMKRMEASPGLPPGIVVIDPTSVQRAAALALAIGRFQPILAVQRGSGEMQTAEETEVTQLNDRILAAMRQVKLLENYGWSGVTLAGRFPIRFNAASDSKANPLAVDDRLGRDERLIRRGVVGRLYGELHQSVYMVMCSLFLQPRSALLVHTYGYSDPPHNNAMHSYHLKHAATTLEKRFSVTHLENERANLAAFREATQPANRFDWFWMNSAGGTEGQNLAGGGLKGDDMPIGRPEVVQQVASWGLSDPWAPEMLAYKSLGGGAYWYLGSTHEPYLQAFVQSTEAAHRMAPGTPLAFASRHLPGHPFCRVWKLMFFGDPLFALRSAAAKRVDGQTLPGAAELVDPDPGNATAWRRLRHAMLTRQDVLAAARGGIEGASQLPPEDLAMAMLVLTEAGEWQRLLKLSERHARHPMSALLMRRALRQDLEQRLASKQFDTAGVPLARAALTGIEAGDFGGWCDRYLSAVRDGGRGSAGIAYLQALKIQAGMSPVLAGAIDAAVKRFESGK